MLLEDRLLMIMEGRQAGKSDEDISQSMGLDVQIIRKYENYLKEKINENRKFTMRRIANRIGVSPLIVDMAKEVYGLKIERPRWGIAKERISQVQALYSEGKSPAEISALMGLKVNTIRNYHYIFLRSKESQTEENKDMKVKGFALKKQEKYSSKREEVLEAAKWYVRGVDIALLTGVPMSYVTNILKTLGTREERKVNVIRNALEEGVNSIDELCIRAGTISWQYLKKFCEKYSLPFPETNQEISVYPRRPEYDKLIAEGVSLGEMGKKLGGSRELARQYINKTGQYEHYRELRKLKNLKARKELHRQLSGLVKLVLERKAETGSCPIKKAVQWFLSLKQTARSKPFEKVVEVFQVYEEAKNKGEKVGVWKLGKRVGLIGPNYGRILKLGGVEPMYGTQDDKVPRNYRINACLRGAKTQLSSPDIAHFLELPERLPSLRYEQKGISKKPGEFLANLGSLNRISYHNASKIYEAHDEGLKREEIAELYGLNRKIIDYVIKNRKEFEKKIVNELRILFNDNQVKWPYVTQRMRKNLELEG